MNPLDALEDMQGLPSICPIYEVQDDSKNRCQTCSSFGLNCTIDLKSCLQSSAAMPTPSSMISRWKQPLGAL